MRSANGGVFANIAYNISKFKMLLKFYSKLQYSSTIHLMKSPTNSYSFILNFVLLGFLLMPSLASAQNKSDSTHTTGLKSYFLLRVGLDTDPVDVQNYLKRTEFLTQTNQFQQEFKASITNWNIAQQTRVNEAFHHASSGNIDASISLFENLASWDIVKNVPSLRIGVAMQMSSLFALKNQYTQANGYQKQILSGAINTKNTTLQAQTYIQLGKLASEQGEAVLAESYLLKNALPLLSKLKDKSLLILCYRELAYAYEVQELFAQAKWFYLQSLTLAKQKNDSRGVILANIALADFKCALTDFEPAIQDLRAAEWVAIQAHELPLLLLLKYKLEQTYTTLGNAAKVVQYSTEYIQLKDILLNPGL
jgi:tetratricopeptide (TPR) repeat protein